MSVRPMRLSELKLNENETPAPDKTRSSRGSKIPHYVPSCSQGAVKKRSLSSEPKSATKIKTTVVRPLEETSMRRSKSTANVCQTPLVTPTRSGVGSVFKSRTPLCQKSLRKETVRPAMDKSWILATTEALHQYLIREKELAECIPKGPLKSMSVKQFVTIIQHFTQQLTGTRVKITLSNYVDELQRMMKIFEYNGQLTRSILIAPNTMHSWPHALALLNWMRIACESLSQKAVKHSRDPKENERWCLKIETIFNMYRFWSQGKDADADMLQEELLNNLAAMEETENTEDLHTEIQTRKKHVEKLISAVNQKTKEFEKIERDRMAFDCEKKSLKSLQSEQADLNKKIEECKNKIDAMNSKKGVLKIELKTLEEQVRSQPVNLKKKLAIELEIADYHRQKENDKKISQSIVEANFNLDLKSNEKKTLLDKIFVEHSSLIYKLGDHLSTASISFDTNDLKLDLIDINHNDLNDKSLKSSKIMESIIQKQRDEMEAKEKHVQEYFARKQKSIKEEERLQQEVEKIRNKIKYFNEEIITSLKKKDEAKKLSEAKRAKQQIQISELQAEKTQLSRHEEKVMDAMDSYYQSKKMIAKMLEENKSSIAKNNDTIEKKIKSDEERLLSIYSSIVKINNDDTFKKLLM